MIPSVSVLIKRVQALLSDPAGKRFDNAYLMPFIGLANEDLYAELTSVNLKYEDTVVTILNVPANTTDLSTYQATGGVLEYMMVPSKVEWRNVGESDEEWRKVPSVDEVADTNAAAGGDPIASNVSYVRSYEWRGEILYLSPCENPVDLRIRFEALPADLSDEQKSIIRGVLNVLSYGTAALVAETDGEMGKLAVNLEHRFQKALDNFETIMVKKDQLVKRIPKKANSGHLSRYGIWGVPILPGN